MPPLDYHLRELAIACDPSRPEHLLPDLSSCRLGVVDVGCGIGQLFAARHQAMPSHVHRFGFDIDASAIGYATRRWPGLATFGVARAESLPLPGQCVDFFVARVSFPYVDIRRSLGEAARVLVPNGRLWITLHPAAMIIGQATEAIRCGRLAQFITAAIAFLNGLLHLMTGVSPRLLGVTECWQSSVRMARDLRQVGFREIRFTRTERHFLVQAVRR
jgi:SAM-dependent methyltransferase